MAGAANVRFRTRDFGPKSWLPPGAPQKNNNPVQLMAGASRDMSWCSAPAASGAAGGRCAPATLACACKHRPPPSSKQALRPNLCPFPTSAATNNGRLFLTAVPPVPAIYLEPNSHTLAQTLGPDEVLTPRHHKGRDDNSAQQTNQYREDTDGSSCTISRRLRCIGGGHPIDGPAGARPGRGGAQRRGGPK